MPSTQSGASGWQLLPAMPCHDPHLDFPALVRSIEDRLEGNLASNWSGKEGEERAILVSVADSDRETAQMSMAELIELAGTAGIRAADTVIQMRRQKNPKYFIGRGKLSEIVLRALQCGVDLLIFDQELNPSQVRAITDTTELRVVDRTQLILDIFAQRAQSREGKIQVEMAQLKYLLPRLGVKDDALSRLSGGIGTRGPGETTLEINRRRIKDRIAQLEDSLKSLRKRRNLRRTRRTRKEIPVISIVGYTNAGKSTLLNALTHSTVFVQDKLFATLDPVSRRLRFPKDFEVIITDTVGFIRNLPKDLIEAFAATLEELQEADLLLHVVDIGNPGFEDQIEAVQSTLAQLDLDKKPTLMVFNKIDTVEADFAQQKKRKHQGITISALNPRTLHPLIAAMEERIEGFLQREAGLAK
jgi:GTP-binding protein HflX